MSDILQTRAFNEAYATAKNVFEKKEIHLYADTLDALNNVANVVKPIIKLTEEHLQFLFNNLLPLLFDDDIVIRKKSIDTFTSHLPYILLTEYQNHTIWPAIQTNIVNCLCKQIIQLMHETNSKWHEIWKILIHLSYKETLTNTNTLNTFLNVVEIGFKSNKTLIAESFICWKVLIELFAQNNMLTTPKRIKLILQPFRPTFSTSLQIAINKFDAWWFLIYKLQSKLNNYVEQIIIPFLKYCFNTNIIQTYSKLIIPSTIAILVLLKKLDAKEYNNNIPMELLENPINDSSFNKICPYIIIAFFKIASVYSNLETTNAFNKLYFNLLDTLLIRIKKLNEWKLIENIIDNLNQKCQSNNKINLNYNKILSTVYEIIGNDKNFLFPINNNNNNDNGDVEQSIKLIQTFTSIILFKKLHLTHFTDSTINNMLKNLYSYKYSSYDGLIAYSIKMLEFIKCDKYIDDNGISFQIWNILTKNLLTSIDFSTEKYFQLLLDYLSWPWNHWNEKSVKNSFIDSWKSLLIRFLALADNNVIPLHIIENLTLLMETFVTERSDHFPIKDNNLNLKKPLKNFIGKIESVYGSCEDYSSVLKKLRIIHGHNAIQNKSFNNKSKLNDDCEFVAIPSVWKLDPTKLTEHQKEKMKERRTDIPALYNDLSQSQDSISIKPWTTPTINKANNKNNNNNNNDNRNIDTDFSGIGIILNNAEREPIVVDTSIDNIVPVLSSSLSSATANIKDKNHKQQIIQPILLEKLNTSNCDDKVTKKKLARELNRLTIDAVLKNDFSNVVPRTRRSLGSSTPPLNKKPFQLTNNIQKKLRHKLNNDATNREKMQKAFKTQKTCNIIQASQPMSKMNEDRQNNEQIRTEIDNDLDKNDVQIENITINNDENISQENLKNNIKEDLENHQNNEIIHDTVTDNNDDVMNISNTVTTAFDNTLKLNDAKNSEVESKLINLNASLKAENIDNSDTTAQQIDIKVNKEENINKTNLQIRTSEINNEHLIKHNVKKINDPVDSNNNTNIAITITEEFNNVMNVKKENEITSSESNKNKTVSIVKPQNIDETLPMDLDINTQLYAVQNSQIVVTNNDAKSQLENTINNIENNDSTMLVAQPKIVQINDIKKQQMTVVINSAITPEITTENKLLNCNRKEKKLITHEKKLAVSPHLSRPLSSSSLPSISPSSFKNKLGEVTPNVKFISRTERLLNMIDTTPPQHKFVQIQQSLSSLPHITIPAPSKSNDVMIAVLSTTEKHDDNNDISNIRFTTIIDKKINNNINNSNMTETITHGQTSIKNVVPTLSLHPSSSTSSNIKHKTNDQEIIQLILMGKHKTGNYDDKINQKNIAREHNRNIAFQTNDISSNVSRTRRTRRRSNSVNKKLKHINRLNNDATNREKMQKAFKTQKTCNIIQASQPMSKMNEDRQNNEQIRTEIDNDLDKNDVQIENITINNDENISQENLKNNIKEDLENHQNNEIIHDTVTDNNDDVMNISNTVTTVNKEENINKTNLQIRTSEINNEHLIKHNVKKINDPVDSNNNTNIAITIIEEFNNVMNVKKENEITSSESNKNKTVSIVKPQNIDETLPMDLDINTQLYAVQNSQIVVTNNDAKSQLENTINNIENNDSTMLVAQPKIVQINDIKKQQMTVVINSAITPEITTENKLLNCNRNEKELITHEKKVAVSPLVSPSLSSSSISSASSSSSLSLSLNTKFTQNTPIRKYKSRPERLLNFIERTPPPLMQIQQSLSSLPQLTTLSASIKTPNEIMTTPPTKYNNCISELFTFSKTVPLATACPPFSILKKKTDDDNNNDISSNMNTTNNCTTPTNKNINNNSNRTSSGKRKRVNFQDPPVSTVKEYISNIDEYRKFTKLQPFDRIINNNNYNNNNDYNNNMYNNDNYNEPPRKLIKRSRPMLAFNSRTINMITAARYNVRDDKILSPSSQFSTISSKYSLQNNNNSNIDHKNDFKRFQNNDEILKYVFTKYSMDDLCEKYRKFNSDEQTPIFTNKSINLLTNQIIQLMSQTNENCSNVIERLSEKYPTEFLQKTIQENLHAKICDQLPLSSLFDYIVEKLKSNINLTENLLNHIPLKTILNYINDQNINDINLKYKLLDKHFNINEMINYIFNNSHDNINNSNLENKTDLENKILGKLTKNQIIDYIINEIKLKPDLKLHFYEQIITLFNNSTNMNVNETYKKTIDDNSVNNNENDLLNKQFLTSILPSVMTKDQVFDYIELIIQNKRK